ncbi:ion transporter [Algihabitans albus]|uniref:ion transporter n=1 Tax=Algihabitans albus TaxID=2164067 RepID=UPI000E5CB621|nr:ion transporter [Algihabitans albus]
MAAQDETAEGTRPDDGVRRIPPRQGGWLGWLQGLIESATTQKVIAALIALNAVTLGLETSERVMAAVGEVLIVLDRTLLLIFTIEILAKLLVYRTRIHKDPWNIFDILVIGIAWMPATGNLSVLRALRILRVLRLISAVPSMRRVVTALLRAIPGMGSIVALLALVYYVFSVMATKLFGAAFPEWFGTIGASAYSLFQIMTLESWSMGIVRPVMEIFPYAWAFFVPFILVTSFTVLNLFIGIIVDAMQSQHQSEADEAAAAEDRARAADSERIFEELRALRRELAELKRDKVE